MSDWIEHEGKKYYEESYLILANNNARQARMETARRCAEIASELEDDDCTAGAVWEAIRREFGLDAEAK